LRRGYHDIAFAKSHLLKGNQSSLHEAGTEKTAAGISGGGLNPYLSLATIDLSPRLHWCFRRSLRAM
jgi:hypothetical protein